MRLWHCSFVGVRKLTTINGILAYHFMTESKVKYEYKNATVQVKLGNKFTKVDNFTHKNIVTSWSTRQNDPKKNLIGCRTTKWKSPSYMYHTLSLVPKIICPFENYHLLFSRHTDVGSEELMIVMHALWLVLRDICYDGNISSKHEKIQTINQNPERYEQR